MSDREAVLPFSIQKKEVESITPFTRKEKYINQIVGGGNTAPETPQTREEIFFAGILGEVVAPSPITRSEKYLAKIANKYSGELPEPVTRIERFLARAAGMDVTIPTPITREEMFWADALIVEKELSGIPPLAFNAVAGTLKNYRIYGNTVNGESVGNLVTDSQSEHYGEYAIPITNNSETANIYLDEPLRKVGDEADYVDYATQKQHRVRKNLLLNTATSQTINGVTFTVNSDGSVTCNGTASNAAWFALNRSFDIYAPDGRIASIGNQGSLNTFYLNIGYVGNVISSHKYTNTTHNNVFVHIIIASGYTCNNLTFYPMIRKADVEDDTYEPYIENSEVDVALPEIAVTAGTNTLTVGTEVQPSEVYIKYGGAR